jgi:ribonuclease HI
MIGTVSVKVAGPVIAATDASLHRKGRCAGLGYLTSDGRWGAVQYDCRYPARSARLSTGVTELAAVAFLFQACVPDVLLTDSMDALRYLLRWRAGDTESMPPDYDARYESGSRMTLQSLARMVAGKSGLQVSHVRGHRGNLLNEAADSLARIAREHRLPGDEARLADFCDCFLRALPSQEGAA